MSPDSKELRIEIRRFLGSAKTFWQGNALRLGIPSEVAEQLDLKRGTGALFKPAGNTEKFLFFDTNLGILLKPIDKETDEKLKNILGFSDISGLTDEDLKVLFGDV